MARGCALRAAQYEALAYLAAGFGVFGLIAMAAKYNDKPSKVPFVSPLMLLVHLSQTLHQVLLLPAYCQ